MGSVVTLTSDAGALTDTYANTTFGEVRDRTGTSNEPHQYVGNLYYDSGSRLSGFHARGLLP